MKGKIVFALVTLVVLLFAGNAMAIAWPDVNVLNGDLNQYSPSTSNTVNILFTVNDPDAPNDANVEIYYVDADDWTRTEITSDTDRNSVSICGFSLTAVDQLCTYAWTMPTGLDGNYHFDVNVQDVANIAAGEDHNHVSTAFQIDTNACDSNHVESSGTVTLDTNCTGFGSTATIYYSSNRQGGCADNYTVYTVPFSRSFGVHTICYYSSDSAGNVETTQGFTFTADSDAYDVALLAELALAALLIFAILASVVIFREQLDAKLMIALTVAAIIVAIGILIFAVVL